MERISLEFGVFWFLPTAPGKEILLSFFKKKTLKEVAAVFECFYLLK